jgi:hypothetical protein
MSVFSTDAKNAMLDALEPDEIQLHDGDPGAAGTSNRVGDTDGEAAAVFAAASSGSRALNAQVDFTNLSPLQSITWISVWDATVFLGKAEVTAGDVAANAAGEWSATTATALTLADPA